MIGGLLDSDRSDWPLSLTELGAHVWELVKSQTAGCDEPRAAQARHAQSAIRLGRECRAVAHPEGVKFTRASSKPVFCAMRSSHSRVEAKELERVTNILTVLT